MDYIKIKFGDEFEHIGSRAEKKIEEIFRPRPVNPMFASKERMWVPQMDMYETSDQIIVRAEIAGVEKENIGVEINTKAVRIFGVRKENHCAENTKYRLAEIQYGRFDRVMYLPSPIDTEIVNSSYTSGFLELRLHKLSLSETYNVPISDG